MDKLQLIKFHGTCCRITIISMRYILPFRRIKLLTNFYELTQLGIASAEVDDRAGIDNSIVGIVGGQHIIVTLSIRTAGTGWGKYAE